MLPGFRQVAESQAAEWSKLPDGVDEAPFVKHMKAAHQYRTLSASTKLWWSATLALVLATAVAFVPLTFAKWGVAALLLVCFAHTVRMAVRTARAHTEALAIDAKASKSIIEIDPKPEAGPVVEEVKA